MLFALMDKAYEARIAVKKVWHYSRQKFTPKTVPILTGLSTLNIANISSKYPNEFIFLRSFFLFSAFTWRL